MTRVEIRLVEEGRCHVRHESSGETLLTDRPAELGGGGRSFSATDLLAASLGACVATSLEAVARRHGLDPARIRITVDKELGTSVPRRIARLRLVAWIPGPVEESVRRRLERAARACPVHRSLHPEVEATLEIRAG